MSLPKHILTCDWGTSSFRMQLIEPATLNTVAKMSSHKGNASIYKKFKAATDANRIQFYAKYLHQAIDEIAAETGLAISQVPILISGMASSSVGMKELPYAQLPFAVNGSTASAEWIDANPAVTNPILLISGAEHPNDVMRGEETQVVGISSMLNLPNDNYLFILPGTHSKHVTIQNNQITSFKTFMTGELFDVIAKHTILTHAVMEPDEIVITEKEEAAFVQGVQKALDEDLLGNLFAVRINQIKNALNQQHNYYYLSGLIIGAEIKTLKPYNNGKIVLGSSGNLQRLYQLALHCTGLADQTVVVPAETLDKAAAAGQVSIYAKFVNV